LAALSADAAITFSRQLFLSPPSPRFLSMPPLSLPLFHCAAAAVFAADVTLQDARLCYFACLCRCFLTLFDTLRRFIIFSPFDSRSFRQMLLTLPLPFLRCFSFRLIFSLRFRHITPAGHCRHAIRFCQIAIFSLRHYAFRVVSFLQLIFSPIFSPHVFS
jgi:hypothetical protein